MSVDLLLQCDHVQLGVGLPAKALFRAMCWKTHTVPAVYGSAGMFAEMLDCSERTVRRAFHTLESAGWIEQTGWRWTGHVRVKTWRLNTERLAELHRTTSPVGDKIEPDNESSSLEPDRMSNRTTSPAELDNESSRTGQRVRHIDSTSTLHRQERPIDGGGDAPRARGPAADQVGRQAGVTMEETPFGPRPIGAPSLEKTIEPEQPKTTLERLVDRWRSGAKGFHTPESDYAAIGDALSQLGNDEARVVQAIEAVRKSHGRRGRAIQVLNTARAMVRDDIQASKGKPRPWSYTADDNDRWADAPETGWPTGPMRKA